MAKYKITFDREACIGALACAAVSPKHWKIADDGKVDLIGGKKNKQGNYELIIDESDLKITQESAEVCPVLVIKIEKTK